MTITVGEAPFQLGTPEDYTVRFRYRGGEQIITPPLTTITSIEWGRRLGDISEATITVGKTHYGHYPGEPCPEPIAWLEPGEHELELWRDQTLVWIGFVHRVVESATEWTVHLRDMLGWLDTRTRDSAREWTGVDLTTIAFDVIDDGFAGGDEGFLEFIQQTPTGIISDLEVDKASKTLWEVVDNDVARQGLDVTCCLRTIMLGPQADEDTQPVARITDDDVIADIEVENSGEVAATKVWAHGGRPSDDPDAEDVIGVYGGRINGLLLERVVSDDTWTRQAQVDRIAEDRVRQLRPPLMILRMPQQTQLTPYTPVPITHLVPGWRFDIHVGSYCRPVLQGMRLAQLSVTWEPASATGSGGGETVQASFVPLRGAPEGGRP